MSHLENVKQYILPADLLLSMLRVYRFWARTSNIVPCYAKIWI